MAEDLSVNETDEGSGAARWTVLRWLLFAAIFVAVVWAGRMAFVMARRQALMQQILGDGDFSLDCTPGNVADVRALVPSFIRMHQKAVDEYEATEEPGRIPLPAFNKRITSWNAILMTLSFAEDPAARDYVKTFIQSEHALDEEARRGEAALSDSSEAEADSEDSLPAEGSPNAAGHAVGTPE